MSTEIIYWLLLVSSCTYLALMFIITMGWFRLSGISNSEFEAKTKVSIIIAARNEEDNILRLLTCLESQAYPRNLTEIILVNDHSDDQTANIIEEYSANSSMKITCLHSTGTGKKQALNQGFAAATGELWITTDADCEMSERWLESIVAYYQEFDPVFISGPVLYKDSKGLMNKLFSLEFMSLVASGAGSLGMKLPLMANGANLAFSADAWHTVSTKNDHQKFASGDDVFLLHNMAAVFGADRLHFLKDYASVVFTAAPDSLSQFVLQRKRWASKAKAYRNFWAIFVSLSVFFFNLMIVVTMFAALYKAWFLAIAALFILFKFLIDFPLLQEFAGFANKRKIMFLLFPLEMIYPLYIVCTSCLALFGRYTWKGRKKLK